VRDLKGFFPTLDVLTFFVVVFAEAFNPFAKSRASEGTSPFAQKGGEAKGNNLKKSDSFFTRVEEGRFSNVLVFCWPEF
jgi:hypothetical protein